MGEQAGPDTIYGSSASCECIFGRDGDDKIWGGKGDTFVFAGKGDDVIRAGPGKNYIDGQKGKDTIWVHAKAQVGLQTDEFATREFATVHADWPYKP